MWLYTNGELGELPEWYTHLRAARYLGVAPWDLAPAGPELRRLSIWRDWALAAEEAEALARQWVAERARRSAR